MAQKQIGFLGAAVCTTVVAKAAELPTPFAGVLGLTVFGICAGVSSFLTVKVPEKKPKAKKLSKKEKRELALANAPEVETPPEDPAKVAKAAKKREKERARKEAKRAAAAAEKVAVAEEAASQTAAAASAEPAEKKLTKEQLKKKKQKEKAKAKKEKAKAKSEAANAAASASSAPAASPEKNSWEVVKEKKGKKKVEEPVLEEKEAPQHTVSIYIDRKYFGQIIGPAGSNLRTLTEATGTEIELPKEGGMHREVLITGSEEGCEKAKTALSQIVKKGYCDILQPGTVDVQVQIPDNKRGIVIGTRGANLKMLQEKLNVKINFPEKGSEDGVAIVGDSKNVKACEAAIQQLMEQGFSSITHENFMQVRVEVPREMLKNLIGQGGVTIKGLQTKHKVQINIPSDKSGEMVVVTLLGEPEGIATCRAEMSILLVPPPPVAIAPEWSQAASMVHLNVW